MNLKKCGGGLYKEENRRMHDPRIGAVLFFYKADWIRKISAAAE